MKTMFWLAVLGSVVVIAFIIRYVMRRLTERERASEARAAELLAQMAGPKPPPPVAAKAPPAASTPASTLETQKLLFDAARKASDAGEPALAVQLYERLLARFPDSGFSGEARAAAEALKKKLLKA